MAYLAVCHRPFRKRTSQGGAEGLFPLGKVRGNAISQLFLIFIILAPWRQQQPRRGNREARSDEIRRERTGFDGAAGFFVSLGGPTSMSRRGHGGRGGGVCVMRLSQPLKTPFRPASWNTQSGLTGVIRPLPYLLFKKHPVRVYERIQLREHVVRLAKLRACNSVS